MEVPWRLNGVSMEFHKGSINVPFSFYGVPWRFHGGSMEFHGQEVDKK